jgi:hypothetical protein
MSAKSIVVTEVVRRGADVKEDLLQFRSGVNVLVGDPNTGKTKWMETIDFLLGDGVTAEQRETDDIFAKFDSAQMTVHIGGEKYDVERKWKQKGALTKVFVNGDPLNLEDYHSLLLKQLGLSPFHYPQGNPYAPRSWPELGWRSLMRHVYRRQGMWADLADKQPPSEQHASLLQFLGVADKAFSSDFELLVNKQKQLSALVTRRENFVAILQEVSRELVDTKELSVALTPQSILEAEERLGKEEEALRAEREALVFDLKKVVAAGSTPLADGVEELTWRLVHLQGEREASLTALRKATERKQELDDYHQILSQERERLERAAEAGNLFANLKVTHCPACDLEVTRGASSTGNCYVCKQPLSAASAGGIERIQFEVDQLRREASEMDDLLGALTSEIQNQQEHLEALSEGIERTQQLLRPVRVAAAAILPPELAIADMSIGRLQEKRNQLQRVNSSLAHRETLAQQIRTIQAEIDTLSGAVMEQVGGVDYQGLGDRLSKGMNAYLKELNKLRRDAWVVGEVAFLLEEQSFKIRVGKADWQTKLGGTLTLY